MIYKIKCKRKKNTDEIQRRKITKLFFLACNFAKNNTK